MPSRSEKILIAASLALAVLLAEALCQLNYKLREGHWLAQAKHTFYVNCVMPVADAREYTLRPGYRDRSVTVDAMGFREPAPAPGSKTLCLIGDSIIFGVDVADEESYPSALGRLLASQGSCLRVLNAGVPSYNLSQAFLRLHADVLPRYRPRLLVVEAFNDIALAAYYKQGWTAERTWSDLRWKPLWRLRLVEPLLRGLRDNLASFYYLSQLSRLRHASRVDDISDYDDPADKMLGHVESLLSRELSLPELKGVPVVLVACDPFYYQTARRGKNEGLPLWRRYNKSGFTTGRLISKYNDVLRKVAARRSGTYFFDSRSIMDATERSRMYLDFVHLSAEGNTVMAEALYRFLSRNDLLATGCAGRLPRR
ncbi:MAG: SGNH/GDSL hydrolase family protein [Elusimicrobia bacterium]|nr:SGNH/GDSL hydrolase family protein [Elusimicrobiota bacterium]